MSEWDLLPLNIQIRTYAAAHRSPAGRKTGRGAVIVRPVTIKRTAATIITKGNERNSTSSAEEACVASSPFRIRIPALYRPQQMRSGLIRATHSGDQLAGGRGSAGASRRPPPRW